MYFGSCSVHVFVFRSIFVQLVPVISKGPCKIDATNKLITIQNLRTNCNMKQLKSIFSSITAGTFPSGKFQGHVLLAGDQEFWNGKNINYTGGDHGTVTNTIFEKYNIFKATIYRTKAPFDGKEVFAIDYKNDSFAHFVVDYVRKVETNLYLGMATLRGLEKNPILFFLLECV